jgi:hypothetical protein
VSEKTTTEKPAEDKRCGCGGSCGCGGNKDDGCGCGGNCGGGGKQAGDDLLQIRGGEQGC